MVIVTSKINLSNVLLLGTKVSLSVLSHPYK